MTHLDYQIECTLAGQCGPTGVMYAIQRSNVRLMADARSIIIISQVCLHYYMASNHTDILNSNNAPKFSEHAVEYSLRQFNAIETGQTHALKKSVERLRAWVH